MSSKVTGRPSVAKRSLPPFERRRSQHEVALRFHVCQSTVCQWVHRDEGQRLDRVDWHDRTHATRTSSRTDPAVEDLVLTVRTELG
jgi:predicted transcriptional regulator